MTRFKLTIEYDGSPFVGWQRQASGMTVQEALEEAVKKFCGETVTVYGAGRTDTGVHARAQVAHVDIEKPTDSFRLMEALNAHLRPLPVAVLSALEVDDAFHARFNAVERRYLYRIKNRRAPLTIEAGRMWLVGTPLKEDLMQAGADHLVGHHDFSSFRAAECQADSPVKTLTELTVARVGAEIQVRARAPSFLHHQVRNIVGSLRLVGQGKQDPGWIAEVLAARDRTRAGPTAPAEGLYLDAVRYD